MISDQVAKLDAVLRHYVSASSVLFKSRWWPYDSTSGVVCTVQVAKTECLAHDTTTLVVRTVQVAKPDCVNSIPRSNVVRIVHLAKPDVLHTTLCPGVVRTVHVAKPNGHGMTLRLSSCLRCTTQNWMASIRFVQFTSRNSMAVISRTLRSGVVRTVHVAKSHGVHTTLRPLSSVLCMSRNRMPITRHYAPASCLLAGRETRLRQYDTALKRTYDALESCVLCTS